MKIAWFTPFSKKSAIGKYSKLATDALSKKVNIDIFSPATDDLLKSNLKIVTFNYKNEKLIDILRSYDFCVYNIGDNSQYHSEIYEVSKIRKGIIICHDATLLGFFKGYYYVFKKDTKTFIDLFENTYNISVSKSDEVYLSNKSLNYGMLEFISKNCLGIIVHSNFHKDSFEKKYYGPIKMLHFPFTQEYLKLPSDLQEINVNENKMNILTVGNVNSNKRIYQIIQAISKSEILKEKVEYFVIGSQGNKNYGEQIRKLIEENKLEKNVKMIDYVSDEELSEYYNKADLICNLRNPALEGASWSLVEQMSLGKTVIVSDNGFYSEMPDDCVCKISLDDEQDDLIEILERFVKRPDQIIPIGKRAKAFIEEEFSQNKYAEKFIEFIKEMEYNKPLEELVSELSITLKNIDIVNGMEIVETISNEFESLFYKSNNSGK